MFFTNQLYSVGEYLPVKTIKGYAFFITNVLFLILLTNIQDKLSKKKIFFPFYIAFTLLFVVLLVENINPNLLNRFHVDTSFFKMHGRIRLLTAESSYTMTLIGLYFLLAYYYTKYLKNNKILSIIVIFMLIVFMMLNTSKGLITAAFISGAIILLSSKKIRKKHKIWMILCFIVISIFLIPYIMELFKQDIDKYTSTITRTYCIINAMILSIIYPLGLGNGMYIPMYTRILNNNYYKLKNISVSLNTGEIYRIANATRDTNIGAKSGIFQYAIYWGSIGTIYFLSFLYDLYKGLKNCLQKDSLLLQFGLIFLVTSITFVIDFDCKYEIFAYISVIINYINSKEIKQKG